MESFKQKRANLLNENPIASHGSWMSKHSITAGSPLHTGASQESPLYQDIRSGKYISTGTGVKIEADTGKVQVGGGYIDGTYIPKTASQKALDWDQDPRNPKGSERKRRTKEAKEREFNKPENVAKRKANKEKLDAALAARKARDAAREAKSAAASSAKREANKAKMEEVKKTRDKRRG